jgi:hypothetical protein
LGAGCCAGGAAGSPCTGSDVLVDACTNMAGALELADGHRRLCLGHLQHAPQIDQLPG